MSVSVLNHPAQILVVCIFLMYLRAHYSCTCKGIELTQLDLPHMTDKILMEKRPLVITDRIKDHKEFVRLSLFRYLHLKSLTPKLHKYTQQPSRLMRASARFTLLYQIHSETVNIQVYHPSSATGVIVILGRYQTLILPPRWRYLSDDDIYVYELHDCISWMLRCLGVK